MILVKEMNNFCEESIWIRQGGKKLVWEIFSHTTMGGSREDRILAYLEVPHISFT